MDNAISGLPLDVDLKIKTEPEDTGYEQYTYDEDDDLNIKLEIKEEIDDDDYDYDDDDDDEFEDDAYSPASSILLSPDSNCKVEIVEQPIKKVRFRYLSELQGTPHGPLLGEKHTKHMKTFPEVRLVGYEGKENVKISCWLVDKPLSSKGFIRPHCHDLVVRKQSTRSEIVSEPHERSVSRENNYTAIFENMVVLHSVQKGSESKYLEKEIKWHRREGALNTNIKMDKKKIQDTIRSINKNEVYLYFEAFVEYQNSIQILCSALSHPIKNLKNPISGDLKICKVLNNFGPCEGNTEVGLFTEKVPPDVKIKFFNRENRWTEIVTPEFVHRNIALTFRTPHYPSDIVDDSVQVNFCLLREADGAESNYMDFTYHLNELKVTGRGSFKRRRYEDHSPEINSNSMESEDSTSQGSLVQDEIIDFLDPVKINKSFLNCLKLKSASAVNLNKSKPPERGTVLQPYKRLKVVDRDLVSINQRQTLGHSNVITIPPQILPSLSSNKLKTIRTLRPVRCQSSKATIDESDDCKPDVDRIDIDRDDSDAPPRALTSLSADHIRTIKALKPGYSQLLKPITTKDNEVKPKKVFHVSKLKFQSYLKMMRGQGYVVKSIT